MMVSLHPRQMIALAAGLALAALTSCAPVRLNTIPEPPPTAKLRVFVKAFTAPGKWKWGTPHEVFVANQIGRVEQYLEQTGIYEVVSENDVRTVLGGQDPLREGMEKNDWKLARDIGRALHADYVMIIERSKDLGATGEVNWVFASTMVNTDSGKHYRGRVSVPRVTKADKRLQVELIKKTYRQIFIEAKDDMLAVALMKGRAVSTPLPAEQEKRPEAAGARERPALTAKAPEQPGAVRKPEAPAAAPVPMQTDEEEEGEAPQSQAELLAAKDAAAEGLVDNGTLKTGGIKLVVYDLDAPEQYRPAALILSEALREELFRLKRFTLVNRETLQQVLGEIALQQTGLIDEKEAVRTGKGLAANQVVTGRLGTLGKLFVFQAKRTDVETFATLGLTSAKFTQGQEEDVLEKLPGLARSLAGQE